MKKLLSTLATALCACAAAAQYTSVALPCDAEVGAQKFHTSAYVRVCKTDAERVQKRVGEIVAATPANLGALLKNGQQAGKAAKFLKLARFAREPKILPFKFGKYTIAAFEIPQKSRMRAGMNFFAFEEVGGELLWDLSLNDAFVSLICRSDIATALRAAPEAESARAEKASSPADAAILARLKAEKNPYLVFGGAPFVSLEPDPAADSARAAKFYRKIQDIFFDWRLEEYAEYMSAQSRETFARQYLGMTQQQRKDALSDYFSWHKKYIRVLELSPDRFLVVFRRVKNGRPDQIDLAYIAFPKNSADGILENFGKKTPLDTMLSRYIFRGKTSL